MSFRWITALPIYNEVQYVNPVLDEVARYSPEILVVDDGSSDGTAEKLSRRTDIRVLPHETNRGYGGALRSAFCYAIRHGFDCIVTIDCDGQHEPQRIPQFVQACRDTEADIVSGSRYLQRFAGDSAPPSDRRSINQQITTEINHRLGLDLTDSFCGFKAYRLSGLRRLLLTENGYAMPLELWVQAAKKGLTIVERPVPLIYLDESRSFGGVLDDSAKRLKHYRDVLERSLQAVEEEEPLTAPLCGETFG